MTLRNHNGKASVLLFGSGGQARAVAEVVKAEAKYALAGLIDSFRAPGEERFGCPVLGGETDLPVLCRQYEVWNIIVALGDNFQRAAVTQRIKALVPRLQTVNAVHPAAVIASDVKLASGVVVMPGAVIVSGCAIGEGCIINTCASIDHDGSMAAWSSLAPGVVTGGGVSIGRRTSLGLGAKVIHNVTIGDDTVIGAGALILQDMPSRVVAYGSPCRPVRTRAVDERYL